MLKDRWSDTLATIFACVVLFVTTAFWGVSLLVAMVLLLLTESMAR